jgi:hypothetical protein
MYIKQVRDLAHLVRDLKQILEQLVAVCGCLRQLAGELRDELRILLLVGVGRERVQRLEEHGAAVNRKTVLGLRYGLEHIQPLELCRQILI